MKTAAYGLLFILLACTSCRKETPVAEVTYSVHETSQAAPSYSIEYTSDQAGGTTVGSNNDNYWTSGKIPLKQGQYISLKVSSTDPEYALQLYIYINGNLWKMSSLNSPVPSVTISGYVPAD